MANLEEFLSLLEEKLVRLNHDREDVQNKVQGVCSKVTEWADFLEEKVVSDINKSFDDINERTFELVGKLYDGESLDTLVKQVREELSSEQRY